MSLQLLQPEKAVYCKEKKQQKTNYECVKIIVLFHLANKMVDKRVFQCIKLVYNYMSYCS